MQHLPDFTRRDFLKTASAATVACLTANAPRLLAATETRQPATADAVIVLWMGGGMSHPDTFDPKRYTPFTKGMKSSGVASTFPSLPTKLDGLHFSEGLQRIGQIMDRGTLIRSAVAADLGSILHSRHQYHWHTGYEPPQTVAAPHIGAWIAHALGPKNEAVPPFIDIGQRYEGNGEAEELKAFQTAGALGSEFGPFRIPEPIQAIDAVRPPGGMTPQRFRNRYQAYKKLLEASPLARHASDYQRESLLRSLENADRLLNSPAAKALDLSLEPPESIAKYLPPGADPNKALQAQRVASGSYEEQTKARFGLGCLLARRLIESGARFVEVTTEYIPFLNWDTHERGHSRIRELKKSIDPPVAQLVLDLEQRGLLDRTLIVLASEFSRSVLTEGKVDRLVPNQVSQPDVIDDEKFYGHHRHFTGAGSVLLFGGGVKRGLVYGKTSDESPFTTLEKPVTVTDLHATIYHTLGIPANHGIEIERRPFYVTKDALGKPLLDLLA